MAKKKWSRKMWVAALCTAVTLNAGIVPASANYTTDFVHEGVGTDYGEAQWKQGNQITAQPVDFSQETIGQMMQAIEDFDFAKFAQDNKDLPWIDSLLVNTGVIPDDGGDDGGANTLYSRGSALYMKTQDNSKLGFVGTVHYADTLNKDTMYSISLSTGGLSEDKSKRKNYPSHGDQTYSSGGLEINQRKFISAYNSAVTLLKLTNKGSQPVTVTMTVKSPFVSKAEGNELIGNRVAAPLMVGRAGEQYVEAMSYVDVHLSGEGMSAAGSELVKEITVPAGGSVDEKVVMGWLAEEIPASKTQYAAFKEAGNEQAFADQVTQYNEWWAQNIPYIDIPDENVKKVLYYRWWCNRFNLLEANIPGNDWQFPMNMEGVLGYNNGITVSVPWAMQDLKWLRDPSYAYGTWLAQGEYSENANYKNNPGRPNIWTWDMMQNSSQVGWEAYKIYGGGDKVLKKFADFSANDVTGTLAHFKGNDPNLVYYNHGPITGNDGDTVSMHWKGSGNYARLDGSATAYANAVAAQQMYEQLGDTAKAAQMKEIAGKIQQAVLTGMWYDESDFDGDGVADTNGEGSFLHKKMEGSNDIFNPWRDNNMFVFNFGVVPKAGESGYDPKYLTQLYDYADPDYYPIFPFFTADQNSIMKRVEAFKNGETSAFGTDQFAWCNFGNYINTIRASLRYYPVNNIDSSTYKTLFDWGAWLHTVEPGNTDHLDSNEFFWLEDYFFGTPWTKDNPPNPSGKMVRAWIHHDTLGMMNYTVLEDMAGLQPRTDDIIELWPVNVDYDHFAVDNVRYHDADLTIVWQDPAKYSDSSPYYDGIPVGYSLFINGERVMTTNEMSHLLFDTATGKVTKPAGDVPGAVGDNTNTQVLFEKGSAVTLASADETTLAGNYKAVDMFNKAGVDVVHNGDNLALAADTKIAASYIRSGSDVKKLADGSTIASITHTSNTALFGSSPNPSDIVTFDLGSSKTVDNVKVYFYNDRRPNGYSAPQTFGVEYLDKDGTTWRPVEGQFRYPDYVTDNYNNVEFQAVETAALRVSFTHASGYSTGIKEIQIYNNNLNVTPAANRAPKVILETPVKVEQDAPLTLVPVIQDDGLPSGKLTYEWKLISGEGIVEAPVLDQAVLKAKFKATGEYKYELTVSDGELATTVEVPVTVFVATADLSAMIAQFAAKNSPLGPLVRNQDDYTPESWQQLQTVLTDAKALLASAEYSLQEIQDMTGRLRTAINNLRYRNAALLAVPSASYTSAWESVYAVNDGFIPRNSNNLNDKAVETQYGNWGGPGNSHWVQYTWQRPVTLSGSSLYFFDDGGGVMVPSDYRFEYWDTAAGAFVPVSGLSEKKMAKNAFNEVTFNEITTDRLRLTMDKQGGSYTGLKEWRAVSAKAGGEEPLPSDHGAITAVEPVSVSTTVNVMPVLPGKVTVTYADNTKGQADVLWDEIPENKLTIATDFVIFGRLDGSDLRASCRIYVKYDKSRLKTAIDTASDPAVNEEHYDGTAEQWEALAAALTAAQAIYGNDASTEGDIESAYKALKNAFEALTPVADHGAAITGITVQGGSLDQVAKEIVVPDTTTLNQLKEGLTVRAGVTFAVYESDLLTLATVLKTGYKVKVTGTDLVTTSIYTLALTAVQAPVNTDQLEEQLTAATALKQELYTEASWSLLASAVSDAVQLLESGTAVQSEIDEALGRLKSAVAGLQLLPEPTATPTPIPTPSPTPSPTATPAVAIPGGTGTNTTSPKPSPSAVTAVDKGTIRLQPSAAVDGKVAVKVTAGEIEAAVKELTDGTLTVLLNLGGAAAKQVSVELPVKALAEAAAVTRVKVDTGSAVVIIPQSFWKTSAGSSLTLLVQAGDSAGSTTTGAGVLNTVTLSIDGKAVPPEVMQTQGIRLALPYALKAGDKAHQVVAYSLLEDGTTRAVAGGKYNAATGLLEFSMKQNGTYTVHSSNIIFTDLVSAGWATEGIEALAARGAIVGTAEGTFKPGANVTRGEFIKILMNAFDLLDETAVSTFKDVSQGAWYNEAVASAQKLGIVNGKGDGSFGASEQITRQEMAVMIYRLANLLKVPLTAGAADLQASFTDTKQLQPDALQAVEAVRSAGLINGLPDGRFDPQGKATRGQAAAVIYRLLGLSE
ncbi:Beta-L-arabinobiosidase precursor [compost metagenome]